MNTNEVSTKTSHEELYILSPVMYTVPLWFDLHSKNCAAGSWFNPTENLSAKEIVLSTDSWIVFNNLEREKSQEREGGALKETLLSAFWNFSQTQLVKVDFCPGNGDIFCSATSKGLQYVLYSQKLVPE